MKEVVGWFVGLTVALLVIVAISVAISVGGKYLDLRLMPVWLGLERDAVESSLQYNITQNTGINSMILQIDEIDTQIAAIKYNDGENADEAIAALEAQRKGIVKQISNIGATMLCSEISAGTYNYVETINCQR